MLLLRLIAAAALVAGCGSSSEGAGTGGHGGETTTGTGGTSSGGSGGDGAGATGATGAGGAGGGPGCTPVAPPVADDCIVTPVAGASHVACDGLGYELSVPAACTDCACGLVFDVHGFTMNGTMEEHNTGLAALGLERGYIVVQPNASGVVPSWNPLTDDDRVFAFLERVVAAFHVDPKRVHFTGFSQGGSMTWRMLCEHSDALASVAPAAYHDGDDGCFSLGVAPAHARPILYMHGTTDALVAFATATDTRDDVIATLGLADGGVVDASAAHERHRYAQGDRLFDFLRHDYAGVPALGGHCYPGSTDPGGEPGQVFSFACAPPNAFHFGQVVMQFFVDHPLP